MKKVNIKDTRTRSTNIPAAFIFNLKKRFLPNAVSSFSLIYVCQSYNFLKIKTLVKAMDLEVGNNSVWSNNEKKNKQTLKFDVSTVWSQFGKKIYIYKLVTSKTQLSKVPKIKVENICSKSAIKYNRFWTGSTHYFSLHQLETSQWIFSANQLNDFYVIETLTFHVFYSTSGFTVKLLPLNLLSQTRV